MLLIISRENVSPLAGRLRKSFMSQRCYAINVSKEDQLRRENSTIQANYQKRLWRRHIFSRICLATQMQVQWPVAGAAANHIVHIWVSSATLTPESINTSRPLANRPARGAVEATRLRHTPFSRAIQFLDAEAVPSADTWKWCLTRSQWRADFLVYSLDFGSLIKPNLQKSSLIN